MSTAAHPAVFLDRDGTLNELVWHESHSEWGPPWTAAELALKPGAADLIRNLHGAGYLVFTITNQPDVAKAKAGLAEISAVEHAFLSRLEAEGAAPDGYEQCLHHPEAVIAEYRLTCSCRKPGTGMIDALVERHAVDPGRSWMVGDRDTDIICGRRARLRTIAVHEPHTSSSAAGADPDFQVQSLAEVFAILKPSGPRFGS